MLVVDVVQKKSKIYDCAQTYRGFIIELIRNKVLFSAFMCVVDLNIFVSF